MNKHIKSAVIGAGIAALISGAAAGETSDNSAIEALLSSYEIALNASDTDAVLKLYSDGGVFMPQHSPSQVGANAVRGAYENVFQTMDLDIHFDILEVVQVAPEWAFARTTSEGVVTINATGAKGPEANQEFFVLNKNADGEWKIARYIFSTTNPPRQ